MTDYWIGTSGYSYEEWRGPFYPDDLAEDQFLSSYADRFSTVETNYTFNRMPNVRTVQGWAKATPDRFVFALKAPRRITHDLRLRDAADPVTAFFETAQVLKHKLGTLLFQLPSFLKRDVARLEAFLHQLPPGPRVAVEFRHQSWFTDEVYECLRRFGLALCVTENTERAVPLEVTAQFGYLRLRKPDYTDEELAAWAGRLQSMAAQWHDVFIYFKQEEAGKAPFLATKLRPLLEGTATPAAAEL